MTESELDALKALLAPSEDAEKIEITKASLRGLLDFKKKLDDVSEGAAFIFGVVLGAMAGAFVLLTALHLWGQLKS